MEILLGVLVLVFLGLALAYQACRLLGIILFALFCRQRPVRPVAVRPVAVRPVAVRPVVVPPVVKVPRVPVLVIGEDLRCMAEGLADLTRVAPDERNRLGRPAR